MAPKLNEGEFTPDDYGDLERRVVPYVPVRCPWCGSRAATTRSGKRLRYHRCLRCRRPFRSLQYAPSDMKPGCQGT